ncbi:MAG: LuxR C-terminal-related transcriptional regulator [Rhodococcus sp. (in: high G+C Gram-positive bacteria)]
MGALYVSAVRGMIFARGRGLYRLDPGRNQLVGQAADVPSLLLDEYATVDMREDPVLIAALKAGRPVASSDAALTESWATCRAQRILGHSGYFHSLKAPLIVGDTCWGTIHFTRYPGDPPFDDIDRSSAEMVVSHLGPALTRAARYEQLHWRAEVLGAALDCIDNPVVITDTAGRAVHENRAARAVAPDGRRAIDAAGLVIADSAALINTGERRAITANSTNVDQSPVAVRSVALRRHEAVVSVVHPRAANPHSALPMLAILSKREREIALFVSDGLTTKEIARRAFITENTVKQHLKRIFRKLNVYSRAEMVHAIWAASRPGGIEADH